MARLGVTFQDIANAANKLVDQGKQPTIDLIRQFLGTGSSTTIANYLRQWRIDQDGAVSLSRKHNLPQELIEMMQSLWERLSVQAGQKADEVESKALQELSELQQELQKYKTNNQRWQQLHEQWSREKAQLLLTGKSLESTLFQAQKESDNIQVKNNILLIQINEKEKRLAEFQKLHQQTQTNLEHYRESTREQRLLEQAKSDQQKQEMLHEIKVLKEQLVCAEDKALSFKQEYMLLQQTCSQLEVEINKLEATREKQAAQLSEQQMAKIEYQQESKHWEKQFHEVKNMLDDKSNRLFNAESDNKVLLQQLQEATKSIRDYQDQNKYLGQEKWMLIQDKAQLESQLEQMQKSLVT